MVAPGVIRRGPQSVIDKEPMISEQPRRIGDTTVVWVCMATPIAYLASLGLGWVLLARWLPPVSPALDVDSYAAEFLDHRSLIMAGAVTLMISTMFLMPFMGYLTMAVRRVEGRAGVLAMVMAISSTAFITVNFLTGVAFALAVFRPDRDPSLVQFAGDAGYFLFLGGTPTFLLIFAVLAYASLVVADRDDVILPRWLGWGSALTLMLFFPEIILFFVRSGPFAYDGLFGFWIPAIVLIGDMVGITVAIWQVERPAVPFRRS